MHHAISEWQMIGISQGNIDAGHANGSAQAMRQCDHSMRSLTNDLTEVAMNLQILAIALACGMRHAHEPHGRNAEGKGRATHTRRAP